MRSRLVAGPFGDGTDLHGSPAKRGEVGSTNRSLSQVEGSASTVSPFKNGDFLKGFGACSKPTIGSWTARKLHCFHQMRVSQGHLVSAEIG